MMDPEYITPEPVKKIRQWIEVCDKAGIGDAIPEQILTLEAYTRLLEARIISMADRLLELMKSDQRIQVPPGDPQKKT